MGHCCSNGDIIRDNDIYRTTLCCKDTNTFKLVNFRTQFGNTGATNKKEEIGKKKNVF